MHAIRNRVGILLATLLLASSAGCARNETDTGQRIFETPEAAAQALVEALDQDDVEAILGIFGREYENEIVTPEWGAEREIRARIASAVQETLEFVEVDDGVVEIVVGAEEWPFPIQLARYEDAWIFDTEEGIEAIIDRRVGRNELATIALARAYVDAQIEYARADRNGDQVLEYAQRLASSPGQRDGLYWEAGPDEEESPFGPRVESAEHYLDSLEPGDPLRGYYLQILTKQGENPRGGRHDYVIDGKMITGFGLVAYPANYRNSGIMTFVVSHRGEVYQKDLGEFSGMDAYDPDDSWALVED
jgi:hypothetical protein